MKRLAVGLAALAGAALLLPLLFCGGLPVEPAPLSLSAVQAAPPGPALAAPLLLAADPSPTPTLADDQRLPVRLADGGNGVLWLFKGPGFTYGLLSSSGREPTLFDIAPHGTTPLPPIPPVPPTPPTPPDPPTPPVPPTPVVASGHCLMVYDANKLDELSVWQAQAVRKGDLTLNKYLDEKCSKTGGHPDWRIFVEGTDVSRETADWQQVFGRPRASLPWIVASGSNGAFWEGAMPPTREEMLAKLATVFGTSNPAALCHIDETNYRQFVGDGQTVTLADGSKRSLGLSAAPLGVRPPLKSAREWLAEAGLKVIPRDKWVTLIQQGQGTFLDTIIRDVMPCKDQDGLNYCWAYATVGAAEAARIAMNLPFVELSAESVGGPVANWRNVGGWGADAVRQLIEVGAAPASYMSAPNSLRPSGWKTGWEASRADFKAYLFLDVKSWDEVITFALLRVPQTAGYNWWRHQVMLAAPALVSGKPAIMIRNSWGASWGDNGFGTLNESKGTPDDCQAILAMQPAEPADMRMRLGDFTQRADSRLKAEIKRRYETVLGTAP